MKLTAHQIIDETVAFYQNNPRSIGPNDIGGLPRCLYNGPNGSRCAFSRCCTDDSKFIEGQSVSNQFGIVKLLPQYDDHLSTFWDSIQCFHDNDVFWISNTLTEEGINYVDSLKGKYS